jgi:hypothetical protein
MTSGRFMRGTDPIKSTWVYPNFVIMLYAGYIELLYLIALYIKLYL